MEPAVSTLLYALATISATFVGFSALIMMLRQTLGHVPHLDQQMARVVLNKAWLPEVQPRPVQK
jgi:hypothetical protein